jgi:glyoxylase-like metal-dependent hydrolase (beta-lactamase superfamily II)/rhodanese-related sulfurtransferase
MITEDLIIDAVALANWLIVKRPVTILDIRPKAEREEWSIPGSIHADVYDRLKANDPHALDDLRLEEHTPIVTVCAGGKTSLKAAEILKQKGFDAYSLDGGMKAWNFAWNIAQTTLHDVKIIQVRRSAKGCLSYIVGSKGDAIVIDAALDPRVYLDLAKINGWTIKYVTDTHVHADYLSRTRELAKTCIATHVLIDKANVEYSYSPIKNGERLEFGNATLEVIHTPGHTLESTSFRLGDDAVFTGDTLFVDGVGRPDLKADQDEALKRSKLLFSSLKQLLSLAPGTLVFPAHLSTAVRFDEKLIAESIETLKGKLDLLKLSESAFVNYTLTRIPPTPPNYLTIASLNKKGSYEGHTPAELEAGANRCAIA